MLPYCASLIFLLLAAAAPTFASPPQSDSKSPSDESPGVSYTDEISNRWQVGVRILAREKTVRNFLVTIPIPTDWPEQRVELSEEDFPAEIGSVDYRELNSGVRQMVITIPKIRAKQLIELTATYHVTTSQIVAPQNTDVFLIPKKVGKRIKEYLGVSPQISYRNAKLRKEVKKVVSEQPTPWKQVEAIYDWVRENIEFANEEPDDTLNVFRNRKGCREDSVGLFVAMCRSIKIPARIVWADQTQYAEFYLVDETDQGHWFPANVSGRREFGQLSSPKIILQKGDNIKVPEKEKRQKFCAEFVHGEGSIKPVVEFVKKRLPVTN